MLPDSLWLAKPSLAGQGSWQREGAKQEMGILEHWVQSAWPLGTSHQETVGAGKTLKSGLEQGRALESACLAVNPDSSTGGQVT